MVVARAIMRRNFLLWILLSVPFVPRELSAQKTDTADIYIAAVAYVRDKVRHYEGGPVVACASVSPPRSLNGLPSPLGVGVDLDSAVLQRIPEGHIPVRPGSACYVNSRRVSARLEAGTDRPAVSIVVGIPEIDGDHAHILAQLSINGRSGRGFACSMIRREAKWWVDSCTPTWIS